MPKLVAGILDPGKGSLYGEICPIRKLAVTEICFYLPLRSLETFVQCVQVYRFSETLPMMHQFLSILCYRLTVSTMTLQFLQ